jgi:hypothetical protein
MTQIEAPPGFEGLSASLLHWLHYEQTFNERIYNPQIYRPIEKSVKVHLRPEQRPVWPQKLIWLPREKVRCYGAVDVELRSAYGLEPQADRAPLFLHPQAPAAHDRLRRRFGSECLPDVSATPTSSYRSVLTWDRQRRHRPVILKLSLGAVLGRIRRALREEQISRAVIISALFDTIPVADRKRLNFDWFSEPAGIAETYSNHGWLLRRFPASLARGGANAAIPVCSLISRRGSEPPLLVELIRRSGLKPERFIVERLLQPYVAAIAYLLFEQGLEYEGHSQNVLAEIDRAGEITGRLYLRDLSDTTVNVAMRIAKRKALPRFKGGFLPPDAPLSHAAEASNFRHNFFRNTLFRGYDTVEQYGLWGFVWPINTVLARWFKRYDSDRVDWEYLGLWQQAAIEHLGLRPLFRWQPKGLATDEAIAHFLTEETDWKALGAKPASLPASAEPLLVDGRMRRRSGIVYDRTECPWGDLYTLNGRPAFFRPAF